MFDDKMKSIMFFLDALKQQFTNTVNILIDIISINYYWRNKVRYIAVLFNFPEIIISRLNMYLSYIQV